MGDALIALHLASIQSEWLPELTAGISGAARDAGRPLPVLSILRLDRRYPLELGFASPVGPARRAIDETRPHVAAYAAVVEFGGWVRDAAIGFLRALEIGAGSTPPFTVHSTVSQGITALTPHLGTNLPAGFYVERARDLKRDLGCADP